jgi:hypothetical protein
VGDARFFNKANAQAAMIATAANNAGSAAAGCQNLAPGPLLVTCYLAHFSGNYSAAAGGGSDPYAARWPTLRRMDSIPPIRFAEDSRAPLRCSRRFPALNQNLGANQMLFPIGFAKNNALQLSLKQHLDHPVGAVKNIDLQVSYQLQSYLAAATDNDFINIATDFNNPQHWLGPNGLDRKNQISFGGTMDLPLHFRFGVIGHFYSPLPVTLPLNPTGNPGGIFVTDVTGDGTGDGSFASNGGFGDVLPGTNVGSFEHGVSASNINKVIGNYNSQDAGHPTPAGQTLINSGLFTSGQLQTPGFVGVQQPIPLAPANEANMGWLHALDISLNWIYKIRETVNIQPGISFFNVMNFANFDGPANPLSGVLDGAPGSVNGTAGEQPKQPVGIGLGRLRSGFAAGD